jgi:hypothetical protein
MAAHRTRPDGGVIEAVARDRDTEPRQPRQVRKLSKRLEVARQVHDLEQDAALDIVDIERLRVSVTRCLWFFLALGSVFTTTGVQNFLAGDLTPADPVWWGCWGVEPCLVGILITVLRWEAAMIAREIDIDSRAVDWLKRFLLCSTLVMNVVPALWPRDGGVSAGMLAAHLMVPILVFFLAEVMPVVQARCTQARRAITLPGPAPTAAPMPPVPATPPTIPAAVTTRAVISPNPAPAPSTPVGDGLDGLGLPPAMQARVHQLAASLDRPITPVDVQQATRLPLPLAAKVVDRLTPATA